MSKIYFRSRLNMAQLIYDVRNKTYQLAQNRKTGQNDEQVAHIDAGDDENALDQIRRSIESYARTLSTQFSPYIQVSHVGSGTSSDAYQTDDVLGRIKELYYGTDTTGHSASSTLIFSAGSSVKKVATLSAAVTAGDELIYDPSVEKLYKRVDGVNTELGSVVAASGSETATVALVKGYYFDIVVAMPSNYDKNMDGAITEAVHDYIVYMACYDWYLLAKPDEASSFTARATQALDIIRQALNKRVAPTL